jgi:hypothetical protein
MVIYNVTIQPDWSIHEAWLQWMKAEHMPAVVGTGCFSSSRLLRLIDIDELDGPTYAAQYEAPSIEMYQLYIDNFSDVLRQEGITKWGGHFTAFRTVMEEVE